MIDLHTHTLFSDGELIPSELAQRAKEKGYEAIAFTDHADFSNMEFIIRSLSSVVEGLEQYLKMHVFYGVEITHVPPRLIGEAVARAYKFGAQIVVVHGETPVEPVKKGTNIAAIEAECDILAHPGLITKEEALKAREKGVILEISGRCGHSFTNGHVFRIAEETGALYMLNSDAHAPRDLIEPNFARVLLEGCGMNKEQVDKAFKSAENLINKLLKRRYDAKCS